MPPKKKGAAPAPVFAAADDGDLEALLAWCAPLRAGGTV
jgi:hypothetical protein